MSPRDNVSPREYQRDFVTILLWNSKTYISSNLRRFFILRENNDDQQMIAHIFLLLTENFQVKNEEFYIKIFYIDMLLIIVFIDLKKVCEYSCSRWICFLFQVPYSIKVPNSIKLIFVRLREYFCPQILGGKYQLLINLSGLRWLFLFWM